MRDHRIFSICRSLLIAIGSLLLAQPCLALRCGTQLVTEGNLALQVREKCGDPVSEELIGYTMRPGPAANRDGTVYQREFKIEQWIYGPEMGYYNVLTFEGGRLTRIEHIKQ